MSRVVVDHRNRTESFVLENRGHNNIHSFLHESRSLFRSEIREILAINQVFIVVASLHATFLVSDASGVTRAQEFLYNIRTNGRWLGRSTNLEAFYHTHIRTFFERGVRDFLQTHHNSELSQIDELRIYVYLNQNDSFSS